MSAVDHRVLTRRAPFAGDPLALYATLAAGASAAGAFRVAAERRTLLAFEPLARLTVRGRNARVTLDATGDARLLVALEAALAPSGLVSRRERTLEYLPAPVDRAFDEEARLAAPGPLDPLRALVLDDAVLDCDAPAYRLAVGLFGYDLVDAFEQLPAPHATDAAPALDVFIPSLGVIIDEAAGGAEVFALLPEDADGRATARVQGRIGQLVDALGRAHPPAAPPSRVNARADLDDAAFAALVARLQAHVRSGDVFQVVPSRAFLAPCPDPLAAFRRLAHLNPSAYAFHLRTPDRELIGCSPESALKVADGHVALTPIAGTRPRARRHDGSSDAEQDARLMAELHLDAKETAEHMMLVDLARNDVARVAESGSRSVAELLQVTRHSHVMHLASTVGGRLRAGLDALHAWVACANAGTLTGAPKLRAMELLREHEPGARGAYGGGLGVLRGDGSLDTAIVIRAAEVRDGTAVVRAGAGVVLDSVPQREAEETRRKAAAVLAALGATEAAA